MASITLEHVDKSFGRVRAVEDLSLHVAEGELVVLVGPSGCGKTTALRLIAGLETPDRGTVRIGGRVVNGWPPKDRNVAMVFQNPALYPHLTARRNLAFPLLLRKVPKPEVDRRVREVAGLLGIESLLERRPWELSGGQQQRVALGRALVRQPASFLLDEPLSHLDAHLRLQLRAEIKRLHNRLGATILYVTHEQEEAMALGNRIAVMRQGRIQQVGSPLEVYRHPANRFVAGFVGSPPTNFLEGLVVFQDGRLWFDDGAQRLAVPDWAARALAGKVNAKVLLGVRPDAIGARPIEGQSGNVLAVMVNAVQVLGSETDVYFSTDRHPQIIARLNGPAPWRVGTIQRVHIDLTRIDFFEPDSDDGAPGRNLCLSPAA